HQIGAHIKRQERIPVRTLLAFDLEAYAPAGLSYSLQQPRKPANVELALQPTPFSGKQDAVDDVA
ncbi:MAG: hypothetical protein WBP72_08350, partial [Rhodocyclaceae bacterium]